MKLTLIAPFRVPFNLDKHLLLSNAEEWMTHLDSLPGQLDQQRVWWTLGRYGARDAAHPVYQGVQDLGSHLRSLYVLKVSRLGKECAALTAWRRKLSLEEGEESKGFKELKGELSAICGELDEISPETVASFDFERAFGEFRIVDNNIALLAVHIPVHTEKLLALDEKQLGLVGEFSMAFTVMALRSLWGQEIREAVEWANSRMSVRDGSSLRGGEREKLRDRLRGKAEQSFVARDVSVFDLPKLSASGAQDYWTNPANAVVAWVSRVISLDPEEAQKEALGERMETALLGLGVTRAEFKRFRAGEDVYGWGPKLRRESRVGDQAWLEALYIAQFHYYSVDIIDRQIPLVITEVRNEHRANASTRALRLGRNVIQEAQMALYDYMDMKLRVAGEARSVIEQVVQSWDLPAMLSNIERKIVNLRDTVEQVSDDVDKRSSTSIETILSIITLVSIVTLPIALHEYLKPTQKRFLPGLLYSAQHMTRGEILAISFCIVIVGLLLFTYLKVRSRR